MKRRWKIVLILVIIDLLLLGLLYSELTGSAISASPKISVTRSISVQGKNVSVRVDIKSNQNIVALREVLPNGCQMLAHSMPGNYSISEFKDETREWIIADSSKTINTAIYYKFNATRSGTISGSCFYFDKDTLINKATPGAKSFTIR